MVILMVNNTDLSIISARFHYFSGQIACKIKALAIYCINGEGERGEHTKGCNKNKNKKQNSNTNLTRSFPKEIYPLYPLYDYVVVIIGEFAIFKWRFKGTYWQVREIGR